MTAWAGPGTGSEGVCCSGRILGALLSLGFGIAALRERTEGRKKLAVLSVWWSCAILGPALVCAAFVAYLLSQL